MGQYSEKKRVLLNRDLLFDLVADVKNYPQFLPWCHAVRVIESGEGEMIADMMIGHAPLTETFRSKVTFVKPHLIEISSIESSPLEYLTSKWEFNHVDDHETDVHFHLDFAFRSTLFNIMITKVFDKASKKIMDAFIDRAKSVYKVE